MHLAAFLRTKVNIQMKSVRKLELLKVGKEILA